MAMYYNSYSSFFRTTFGSRLQKISIDAGFGCPNRDPSDRSMGGCSFCNNAAFNPSYCSPAKKISQQIDEGVEFHERRYRNADGYLAYFQAYSNTFAPLPTLERLYSEALQHPEIKGIIIGTRPDCVDEDKLDFIASLKEFNGQHRFVAVEYGIESCYDSTLIRINRGHDFAATRRAVEMTAQRGIHCGGHLIIGLPGESRSMILDEAGIVNSLTLNSIKLHQLQILKGSALEHEWPLDDCLTFPLDEYISLVCDILERLRPDLLIERMAGEVPPRFQAHPELSWRRPDGRLIRNEEIAPLVNAELQRRGSRQGAKYNATAANNP